MMWLIKNVWALLCAVMSGLMLALCFPGFDVSGLVWVWAIPLVGAIWFTGKRNAENGKRVKWRGFGLGWLSGMVFWTINVSWLSSMGDLEGVPVAAAAMAWFSLSAYLSIYFGVWGAILASVGNPWLERTREEGVKKDGLNSRVSALVEEKLKAADTKRGAGENFYSGIKSSLRVMLFSLLAAASWVVLEWLRGWLFTGFAWSGLGVAFHDSSTIAQSADLVGVVGLSFLPIMICTMLVQLAQRMLSEAKAGKFKPHYEIAMSVGLVALVFVYGIVKIAEHKNADSIEMKVILLQENIEQSMKWGDEAQQMKNYAGYSKSLDSALKDETILSQKEALERAVLSGNAEEQREVEPHLVLMPESSFTQGITFIENFDQVYLNNLDDDFLKSGLLKGRGYSVIFGSNLYEGKIEDNQIHSLAPGQGSDYNIIALATPDAERNKETGLYSGVSIYGKVHLVPFGEFFPEIPFSDAIYGALYGEKPSSAFTAGTSLDPLILDVDGQKISVIPAVCFEDTVARVTRKFVRDEPQVIVNITNDGWFGTSLGAIQHMANAKFRAIELRRPMIRSANTGVSAIIDTTGSVVDVKTKKRQIVEDESGNVFIKGTLYGYARVPVDPQWTLYALLGDWFVWFCLAISIASGVWIKTKLENE